MHIISKDNEKALEYFNKSLEINPKNDNTLVYLGIYHMQNNQIGQGEIYMKKALEIN